jgi:hypothetical protein
LVDKVQGLITVTTRPVKEDHPPVRIAAVHYTDGWGYRVELPERIEKTRFFEVAVAVILGETANRSAGVREAELPPWLAEGLAAELLATSLPTLALEPGAEIARRERNPDPLRTARELLRQRPALKFDELCMAEPDALDGEERATYRACAHLFVHELLRLRDGRANLREMLARLPRNLNWQTTFLQTFSKHFQRLIDVDKWYTLATLNLSGRDPMSVWPLEMSRKQLDEVLLTRVQVRLETNELPIGASVSLQRIISEWDLPRQQRVLLQKINHLQALRLRAAPELVDLLDDYLQVLQTYTADRGFRGAVHRLTLLRGRPSAKLVIRRLDELDARRQVLGGHGSVRGEAH